MATNRTAVDAAPEAVWAVLANAQEYPRWVVGAKGIRAVDGRWPEPGSRFHHSIGLGPLTLQDNTECLLADPPTHLVLEARGRPLGRARIELTLTPVGTGTDVVTEVVMDEVVVSPPLLRLLSSVIDPVTSLRNAESLRRLRGVVRSAGVTPPA